MNTRTRAELEARLRELESESEIDTLEIEEPAPRTKGSDSLWDFELAPDWQPEPRYLSAEDCQDTRIGFQIGNWYLDRWTGKKQCRQAYPHPTYRNCGATPGDLITNTLILEHARLEGEWRRASTDLESCIRHTRQKLQSQGKLDGCPWLNRSVQYWEESDEKRWLEHKWNFLLGLWQGLGMNPPTQEQLEAWARE